MIHKYGELKIFENFKESKISKISACKNFKTQEFTFENSRYLVKAIYNNLRLKNNYYL